MSPASAHRFDLSDPEAQYYCSECAAPYARAVRTCVSCGASTFWTREDVARYQNQADAGLGLASPVELVVAQNSHEAELIRDGLHAAKIRFVEQTDQESTVLVPGAGRPTRFFVAEADVERADEVLDDVEDQLDEAEEEAEDGFLNDDDDDDGDDEDTKDTKR